MTRLKRVLLYLYAFSSFFQAQFLTINLHSFRLSIGRVLLLVFAIGLLLRIGRSIVIPDDYLYRFLVILFFYQFINIINGLRFGIGKWLFLTYLVAIYYVLGMTLKKIDKNADFFKKILVASNLGILIQVGIGLFEHFTGIYLWTSSAELFSTVIYFKNMKFPCAMQENPNDFAFLMIVGMLVSAILLLKTKSIITKVFLTCIMGCEVYLIYVAGSRGVLLGLILAIVYILSSEFFFKRNHTSKQIIITVLILTAFLMIFVLHFDKFIGELTSHLDFSGGNSVRKGLIVQGINSLLQTLGLGYGVHGIAAWHNHFIEILAEFGIIIFVLFLRFYYELFKRSKIVADRFPEERSICLLIRGFLLSLVFCFVSPASILNIEWYGFVVVMIIAFLSYYSKEVEII